MNLLVGIDIGGTKCAVCASNLDRPKPSILAKRKFSTPPGPVATLAAVTEAVEEVREELGGEIVAIGISCGGPLDSRRGLILGPPNLPGWDEVDLISPLKAHFGTVTAIQNDANAGALAEWLWGAGAGLDNVVFLTFGTGMGAGLILNGRLYAGTNDMGGEVGHLRLAEQGPVGFGKAGSFEGFCSGGGIGRLATLRGYPGEPSAADLGKAAQDGDPAALAVWDEVAERLGQGLAILIDVLNPQRIILGSIFGRQRQLLEPGLWKALRREAIPLSLGVCDVVPAALGEEIGDFAALAVALHALEKRDAPQ